MPTFFSGEVAIRRRPAHRRWLALAADTLGMPADLLSRTALGSAIFANKPGDGSAREQAASCQRVLGGAANFAREYATKRYRSNLISWGMFPFLSEEALAVGDYVLVPDLRRQMEQGSDAFAAWVLSGGTVKPLTLRLGGLTADERQILLDGSLINYYKNR